MRRGAIGSEFDPQSGLHTAPQTPTLSGSWNDDDDDDDDDEG